MPNIAQVVDEITRRHNAKRELTPPSSALSRDFHEEQFTGLTGAQADGVRRIVNAFRIDREALIARLTVEFGEIALGPDDPNEALEGLNDSARHEIQTMAREELQRTLIAQHVPDTTARSR